jgi:hypothetical protein
MGGGRGPPNFPGSDSPAIKAKPSFKKADHRCFYCVVKHKKSALKKNEIYNYESYQLEYQETRNVNYLFFYLNNDTD